MTRYGDTVTRNDLRNAWFGIFLRSFCCLPLRAGSRLARSIGSACRSGGRPGLYTRNELHGDPQLLTRQPHVDQFQDDVDIHSRVSVALANLPVVPVERQAIDRITRGDRRRC